MVAHFSQILVHMDCSANAAERLRLARQIGSRHGAAVAAMYAATPSFVELPFAPEIGASVAADMRAIDEERTQRARRVFDAELATPGAHATWAEIRQAPVTSVFAQQALYADLMVLGQHNPEDAADEHVPADFAQSAIELSGKPALLLPYVGAARPLGGSVLVAWKATRESARAVAAAAPLLQAARRVHVVAWGRQEGEDQAVEGTRLDLDSWLKLRGISATWHRQDSEPAELGSILMSLAFDVEADLLVMGCYGHSRAREWVLGGATRTVLRSMTLPVLMAH
jgi:nucleotide-binding universal stress UspA family protein